MIQTASCSIGSLFTGNVHSRQEDGFEVDITGRLNIPEYQRPYLWGKKEVDKPIKDLREHFSRELVDRPDFYLGSIILHRQGGLLNVINEKEARSNAAIRWEKKSELKEIVKLLLKARYWKY